MTEFYDDYIDSYGSEGPPAPAPNSTNGGDRVGAWARSNANPNYPPLGRSGSRSAPTSQYAPSSFGGGGGGSPAGGSVRRRTTSRRNPRMSSRIQSTYEEEEEGYGSGEYDEGPYDLTLIRVKVNQIP